jgi:hypothetical protein
VSGVTAKTEVNDLNVIAPDEETIDIAGIRCRVRRVRLRELMLLARVITAGVGSNLADIDLGEGEEFQSRMMALLVMAVPEAGDELVDLFRALIEPADKLTDAQTRELQRELANPDPTEALGVVEILARQEKDTFPLLMGKARQVFGAVSALYRTGQKADSTKTAGTGRRTRGAARST